MFSHCNIFLRKFSIEIITVVNLFISIARANLLAALTISTRNPFLRRTFRGSLPKAPLKASFKTKVVALYLPQFHEVNENNVFWGSGFTEWTNVKKATPNFFGHYQPHVPADKKYYNLDDVSVMEQQMKVAELFGIDAFGVYYYLFDGKPVLEKPINNILNSPAIQFPYFLIWANENWTRTWDGAEKEILLEQNYSHGWEKKFVETLIPFLQDNRYFKFKDKSLVGIYLPGEIPNLDQSILLIRGLVRASLGTELFLIGSTSNHKRSFACAESGIDAKYVFPPNVSISNRTSSLLNKISRCQSPGYARSYVDYIFNKIARNNDHGEVIFNGVFPSWDNTPRRGARSRVILGASPRLFESWLYRELLKSSLDESIKDDLIFINAWNEWGEGCHLEPDEKFGYKWLWAVRNSKQNVYKRTSLN